MEEGRTGGERTRELELEGRRKEKSRAHPRDSIRIVQRVVGVHLGNVLGSVKRVTVEVGNFEELGESKSSC